MFKRLFGFLKKLFGIKERQKKNATDGNADRYRENSKIPESDLRFRNLFFAYGIRQRRGFEDIWQTKVGCFEEAYRTMLRICPKAQVTAEKKNGHIYCRAVDYEGNGFVLSDRVGNRRGVVALMKPLSGQSPYFKEIRFYLKN